MRKHKIKISKLRFFWGYIFLAMYKSGRMNGKPEYCPPPPHKKPSEELLWEERLRREITLVVM